MHAPPADLPRPITELADGLANAVGIAHALVSAGRAVDLSGVDDGVGLLCARTLDLPHGQARLARPHLLRLRDQVDRLAAALRHPAG